MQWFMYYNLLFYSSVMNHTGRSSIAKSLPLALLHRVKVVRRRPPTLTDATRFFFPLKREHNWQWRPLSTMRIQLHTTLLYQYTCKACYHVGTSSTSSCRWQSRSTHSMRGRVQCTASDIFQFSFTRTILQRLQLQPVPDSGRPLCVR